MNELYDMSTFEPEFEKFIEENEWGTSVYSLCYEAGAVSSNLKKYVLNFKFKDDKTTYQEIADRNVPPHYMRKLRDLIKYNDKLYNEIKVS